MDGEVFKVFLGGGLHVLPDPGGSSSSAVSRDVRGEGFFF